MTRTAPPVKRRWLAWAGVATLALAASGCEPPDDSAVTRCTATTLPFSNVRGECSVGVVHLDGPAAAGIKVDTPRRYALVQARFTVQQGTVKVVLRGSTGGPAQEVVVRPGAPATLEGIVRLRPKRSGFHLRFEPDGQAAGLEGTLRYESRSTSSRGGRAALREQDHDMTTDRK